MSEKNSRKTGQNGAKLGAHYASRRGEGSHGAPAVKAISYLQEFTVALNLLASIGPLRQSPLRRVHGLV